MSGTNYYTLIASLREYSLDADSKGFDARSVIDEVIESVDRRDARIVRLLYMWYDCDNLAMLREGGVPRNGLGNLSQEELEEELRDPSRLPASLALVIRAYGDPEGEEAERVDTARPFRQMLFSAYYAECARSESRFMRDWSTFDRNLRNVTAALAARTAARPVEEAVVGDDDVAAQLRRSSAADFGLRNELPYIEPLIAILGDERNLLEKERKIDMIRWNEAAELSTFDYFDINAVLAYLVRLNLVARWARLDPRQGRTMLDRLLSELNGKELISKQNII